MTVRVFFFRLALLFVQGIFLSAAFAKEQLVLAADNADWTVVIGGEAVVPPEQTSYGFVVLTDGKMISACTENGVKLWEKSIPGRKESFFSVISKDFIVTVSDKSTVSLINPSGVILWSKKLPYQVAEPVMQGRDARFFVKGRRNVSCFGINGVCKWSINAPQLSAVPLMQLNDGTILAVLANTENGKSSGLRISPFGTVLETICFAGIVSDALTVPDGVLLSFAAGGFGLCSVNKNATDTKWAVPSNDFAFKSSSPEKGSRFVSMTGTVSALVLGSSESSAKLILFENASGKILNIFHADGIDFSRLSCAAAASDGNAVFLSDAKNGKLYNLDGQPVWSASLPGSSSRAGNWNYITYTKNNVLVVCSKSWVMNGFRTIQSVSKKKDASSERRPAQNPARYEHFYTTGTARFGSYARLDERLRTAELTQLLRNGMYGEKEIDFASELISACRAYNAALSSASTGSRTEEKPLFSDDTIGLQNVVAQLSLLGTDDVPKLLAAMLALEKNTGMLTVLLNACGTCAYDPEGQMLRAIESRLLTLPPRNSSACIAASNALYEICRFMGRPAFFSHCMELQKSLLSSQYDKAVHEAVRKNLSKTAALKM